MAMLDKFVEPFGHFSPQSKLERVWDVRIPGHSIQRRRIQSFDALSGVSFSPVEYWQDPIKYFHVKDAPDESWVENAFLAFVKGEFGGAREKAPPPLLPKVSEQRYADPNVFQQYMLSCERHMLYRYYRSTDRHTEQNLFENFRALLADAELGNKKNRNFAPFNDLEPKINKWAETESRLLCLLPAFPFKDQSLLRTRNAQPDAFDLGEMALLIRLHLLCLAFYQFHPWGVDWLISADGNFYADMFGIDPADADSYLRKLKGERTKLNLTGTVSIIDLEEIIDHYRSGCEKEFARDRQTIYDKIIDISRKTEGKSAEAFWVLRRGMRQNLSTRFFENEVSEECLWKICNWSELDGDEPDRVIELHELVGEKATEIAVAYAAENILIKRHDVLNKVFPGSIRTTIHAKPGQVAVPQIGTCFPWNGVAYMPEPNSPMASQLEVRRFHELGRATQNLTAYIDPESTKTLYYSPAK